MHRFAAALCVAVLPFAASSAPASAAPGTVDAVFADTHGQQSCTSSSCTVTGVALVCQTTGVDGRTGVPFAGGCFVHMSLTFPVVSTPAGPVCLDGRGELTYSDDRGVTFTVPVAAEAGNGVTQWHGTTTSGLSAAVASGTVTPTCAGEVALRRVFAGTVQYGAA